MGLYQQWEEKLDESRYSAQQINDYIRLYYEKEKEAYAKILSEKKAEIGGTVTELAEIYGLEPFEVTAFIDGINTSLESELDANALEADTQVELKILWEKLYYNMCKAKAPWLYELPEWDQVLDTDKRLAIRAQYKADMQAVSTKVGRNDPCPCGSGKKYKKCCGK